MKSIINFLLSFTLFTSLLLMSCQPNGNKTNNNSPTEFLDTISWEIRISNKDQLDFFQKNMCGYKELVVLKLIGFAAEELNLDLSCLDKLVAIEIKVNELTDLNIYSDNQLSLEIGSQNNNLEIDFLQGIPNAYKVFLNKGTYTFSESINDSNSINWLSIWYSDVKGFENVFKSKTINTIMIWDSKFDTNLDPLFEMEQLSYLDLSFMSLEKIPEITSENMQLNELVLLSNKISSLPLSITKLKNLSRINLKSNNLRSFPCHFCDLRRLEEIILSTNEIESIDCDLSQCSHISYISLFSNKLPKEEMDNIRELFPYK